jgi:hypothetical protein
MRCANAALLVSAVLAAAPVSAQPAAPAPPSCPAGQEPVGAACKPLCPPGSLRTVLGGCDRNTWKLVIPPGLPKTGPVDVLVHLHGTPAIAERELLRAKKTVALVAVHIGERSSTYGQAFQHPDTLQGLLDAARARLGAVTPGKLFLSSFSAGYGGIRRVLQSGRYRVAWLHLADSLHADFDAQKKPLAEQMAPFVAFARSGKPMWVAHSSVPTFGYASTTQTADALLEALGAKREPATGVNARGMALRSRADAGELHVRGYSGATGAHHMQHLSNLGEYWAKLP